LGKNWEDDLPKHLLKREELTTKRVNSENHWWVGKEPKTWEQEKAGSIVYGWKETPSLLPNKRRGNTEKGEKREGSEKKN